MKFLHLRSISRSILGLGAATLAAVPASATTRSHAGLPRATLSDSAAGTMSAMPGGTTNDYTQGEYDQARAAATAAGFLVGAPTFVQAGNFFFRGEKQGQNFFLTVTPDGKVYPSQPFHGVG